MNKTNTQIRKKLMVVPNPHPDNPLTMREMHCLMLLATGKNPDQCGDIMNITYSTVVTYEKTIRYKLGARNRVHAFYIAIRCGYFKIA